MHALVFFVLSAVPLTEPLWARFDKVNSALAGKTVPAKIIAEQIAEGDKLLGSFDAEYQRIRADAFDHDFKQAESLSKRVQPAFTIGFDGDSDLYAMSFLHLASLAESGSEAAEFFAAYPRYATALRSEPTCLVRFDGVPTASAKKPPLQAAWKAYAATWKEPFFKSFADRAVACLSGQRQQ